jgi:segregation and condensation protein A
MTSSQEDRVSTRVGEFPVELPVYTGPFRVLAELILDRKVDVCDVPVARVVEDFLARADEAEGWSLEEATWFLAICAVLLELKVGRLLPKPERQPDEEDLLGASPDLAYARALELAAFRKVARDFTLRMAEAARHVPREAAPPEGFAHLYPDVLERVTPDALAQTAAALLRPAPMVDLSHVTPIRATVEEAVESVTLQLTERQQARFRELVADCSERIQVVVRFLALLELHRQGRVSLAQAETFGDIEVSWL